MFIFCYTVLSNLYSFAIRLPGKIELVVSLLLLSSCRLVTALNVLFLFFTVQWYDMQCMSVVYLVIITRKRFSQINGI